MDRDWIKLAVIGVGTVILAAIVIYPFYECGLGALAYGDRALFAAVFGECR